MSLVILSHSSSFRPSFLQPAIQPNAAKFISNCSKFQPFLITLYNWSHRLQYFFIFRRSTVLQASKGCRLRGDIRAAGWWVQLRRTGRRNDDGSRSGIATTKVHYVRTKAWSETTSFVKKLTSANSTQTFRSIWWNSQAVERPSGQQSARVNKMGVGRENKYFKCRKKKIHYKW